MGVGNWSNNSLAHYRWSYEMPLLVPKSGTFPCPMAAMVRHINLEYEPMTNTYTPRYADAKAIDKACKAVAKSEAALRQTVHDLLCSAVHHHISHLPSGSVGSELSKVVRTLRATALSQFGIALWIKTIFPDLSWSEKKGVFTGSAGEPRKFKIDGEEKNYWEVSFHTLDRAMNAKAWQLDKSLDAFIKRLEREIKKEGIDKSEKSKAELILNVVSALRKNKANPFFAKAASMVHAGKELSPAQLN